MDSKNAIEVRNLNKHFRLPVERNNSIKQAFVNWVRGVKGYKEQRVLSDISFDIKKGDFFGIVGRNGSGKSTLLKLISGIYQSDRGSIRVDGSLVSFIELGVGFNPELTGRENVYLNGALIGFTVKEIDALYDEIVEFAELTEFMDQKLKNYSSGMQVRLAFSCAIRAHSDILVLDEVLAVGDEAFQRKCDEFFRSISEDKSKTVVLVTHSMDSVRKYCSKAIMIRNGKIVVDGSPDDVANEYTLENASPVKSTGDKKIKSVIRDSLKLELLSPRKIFDEQPVKIRVSYRTERSMDTKIMMDLVDGDRRVPLYSTSTEIINSGKNKLVQEIFTIRLTGINDINFRIALSVRDREDKVLAFMHEDSLPSFIFRSSDYPNKKKSTNYAILRDRGQWQDK